MSDDSDDDYANPLPPPRREDRGRSGGGNHPLSNADFRELIKSGSRKGADEHNKNKKNKPRPPRSMDYYEEEDEAAAKKEGEAGTAQKKKDWRKFKNKHTDAAEGADGPQYRDRAKERREEKNPDYDATQAEMAAMRAVAPPGQEDKGDTYKISIEKSKFLGGDLEHTHLVKGLDYALLQKIRSEMTKETKGDAAQEADGDQRAKPTERVEIRSAQAKAIYSLMFEKKEKRAPVNERFLPGRTSFVFDMEDFASEVPTTVLRSKEDCPPYEELVGVGVDKKALESLTKIMTYLRLGTTGKALKKLRRKERLLTEDQDDVEDEKEKAAADKARMARDKDGARNAMPPPPPPPRPHDDDDIFEGVGREYQCALPPEPPSRSNGAAGHEGEASDAGAQRGRPQGSYFDQPSDEAVPLPPPEDAYMPPLPPPPPGLPPLLPPNPPLPPEPQWAQHGYLPGYPPPPTYMPDASGWQPPLPPAPPPGYAMGVYAVDPSLWAADVAAAAAGLHMPPPPPPVAYGYAGAAGADDVAGKAGHEPGGAKGYDTGLTVEEKNQGLGSVFKRDDQRLKQMREKDDREKDPMFVSDSYSECYPSYQNFNTEVMDGSDDEEDLTKMDMGAKAKGRMHRWDFETEEEWSAYNENKEAMPKAAFQYGVKMADGRKTRKTKEQKLNTQYQQITQIWKKKERDSANEANAMAWPEPEHPGKKAKY